jgi:hypothetical protein
VPDNFGRFVGGRDIPIFDHRLVTVPDDAHFGRNPHFAMLSSERQIGARPLTLLNGRSQSWRILQNPRHFGKLHAAIVDETRGDIFLCRLLVSAPHSLIKRLHDCGNFLRQRRTCVG